MLPGESDTTVQLDHVARAQLIGFGCKGLCGMGGEGRVRSRFVGGTGRPVDGGACLLDLRSVLPADDVDLAAAVLAVWAARPSA